MFLKTLFAILVTMGFAGAAVYYGSQGKLKPAGDIDLQSSRIQKETLSANVTKSIFVPDAQPRESISAQPMQDGTENTGHTERTTITIPTTDENHISNEDIIIQVMQQAAKINAPELKDQAYLDVVEFAVRHNFYEIAGNAMGKIRQAELRDTARSQIAISMAQAGRADEAFKVIDQVEVDALRDVMRLQVIEALVFPNRQVPAILQQ